MKKILTTICLAALACFAAPAQQIRDIDETVVIRADGSARVTQVWDVSVVSGTEFYLPFDNLGPMNIDDLTVSENGKAFFSEGDGWDTDRTRDEKRGRCGIVRKRDGVELCWGQGDYGDHVWTVSYTITGLVMKMGEYNGLYFSFVNPGLSAAPRHVKVTLVNETGGPQWTPDNVKVWGFRSPSEIYVEEDGTVRAESTSSFSTNSAMTVLVRFDPELLTPSVTYKDDFEKVQKMAFKGSDYKKKFSLWETLENLVVGFFVLVCLLLSPGGLVVLGILIVLYLKITSLFGIKYRKGIYGQKCIKGWSRDVPLQGSIPAAYFALTKGNRLEGFGKDYSKNLIGAYFLKWVLDGVVSVVPDPKKQTRVNLNFEQDTHFAEPVENDLYQMVREASGENLLLEAGELEKWSKKSFKRISNLPSREQTRGLKWFQDKHYMVKNDKCTPEGQEQARHLIEFKNYLEDFTLSKERGAVEVTLWRDYLVFAALFGIADKVAKEFQKLYPAEFSQFAQSSGMIDTTSLLNTLRVSHDISASAMRQAVAEKAARSSSSGGGRSFGGGGGFSGGGGGGSFGGSFGGGSR